MKKPIIAILVLLIVLGALFITVPIPMVHATTFSEVQLDFDSGASPTQTGWQTVAGGTTYTAGIGFGWNVAMANVDRGTGSGGPLDDLEQDIHWAGLVTRTFRIDVPDPGLYNWTWYYGDAGYGGGPYDLYVNGILEGDDLSHGVDEWKNETGESLVTIDSVYLNFTVVIGGNSKFNGVEIETISVTTPPTWWDHDWHHRAPINITGSTVGDLTNYPVQFDLFAGSGACSGNDIYMNGTAQADYDDIRFVYTDQVTLLNYWLVDNYTWVYPDATVWVNVTNIPESPDVVTIWAYWNNDEASSLSNGTAVFPFFDDLLTDPDTNADWIVVEGTADFVSHHGWYVRVRGTAGVNGWSYIKGDVDLILTGASETYGWSMEWDQAISSNAGDESFNYWGAGLANDLSHEVMAFDKLYKGVCWFWRSYNPFTNRYFHYIEWDEVGNVEQYNITAYPWTYKTGFTLPPAGWSRYKMTLFTDSSYVTRNGTEFVDFDSLSANYLGVGQNPSYSGHGKAGDANVIHGFVNWVFMRPLADPEPTPAAGSSESVATDIGIHNMGGCGDWVFEGLTQYIFYINVSSTEDVGSEISVGLGFYDDAGDFYSFYYNNETGRITLVTPDDGISASLRDVETGDTWVSVNFTVIFKPNVADTLDVDLYVRWDIPSIGDSGWYAHTADYFNIYNEGGFAALTASGWAGRTPGGDVFEIFAADTRTKNIMPLENFDVREGPINWWEFGTSEQDLTDELTDWLISMPSRDANHTVYPTNRRPDGAPAGVTTYFNFSYPFGLRVYDYPNSHLDHIFAEKQFRRPITAVTSELVIVQVYVMTPEDSGTVGRIVISDTGLYNKWVKGGAFPNEAVEFKFDGGGNFKAIDNYTWTQVATYNAWQWYNITFVLDMTAQTFDIYVDEVLSADDFEFDDVGCVSIEYLTLGQYVWAVGNYTDVYFDEVLAKTDFDGNCGGDAKATSLFRYLQHWSMDWDFKVEEGSLYVQGPTSTPYGSVEDYSNHGFIELGWDVCLNGTWENNFLVARINITDGKVRGNHNWVEFNITWTQNGTYMKHDLLYGLFGTFKAEAKYATKDATGWHWDIWFNRMNASTVIGARLNTEYFGMTNKATWTWGSNWKPVHSDFTESSCFVDLDDSSGVTHSVKEVDMVRPWVRVYRDNRSTFHYAIANIETEFPETSETMSGIDTPEIQDTMVPQGPPPSGIAAFLSSAIKRIMEDLLDGMLMGLTNLGTITVGLVDFIGGMIGAPKFMSNVLSVIDNSWGFFTTIMSEVPLFTMIGGIFTIFTNTFGFLISALMRFVGFFFHPTNGLFAIVGGIWDGTSTFISGLTSFWSLISPDDWPGVLDFLTVMCAIGWFDSIDKRAKRTGGGWVSIFIGDLQMVSWVASFLWDSAMRVLDMTVNIILRVILILKRG